MTFYFSNPNTVVMSGSTTLEVPSTGSKIVPRYDPPVDPVVSLRRGKRGWESLHNPSLLIVFFTQVTLHCFGHSHLFLSLFTKLPFSRVLCLLRSRSLVLIRFSEPGNGSRRNVSEPKNLTLWSQLIRVKGWSLPRIDDGETPNVTSFLLFNLKYLDILYNYLTDNSSINRDRPFGSRLRPRHSYSSCKL